MVHSDKMPPTANINCPWGLRNEIWKQIVDWATVGCLLLLIVYEVKDYELWEVGGSEQQESSLTMSLFQSVHS